MHKLFVMPAAILIALSIAISPASALGGRPHQSERFTVVFAGAAGTPGAVIATGPIHAIGTITPNEDDESGLDTFVFAQGTITVHSDTSTTVQPPTPPACITRFRSNGSFELVGGTGDFAGVAGQGWVADNGFVVSHVKDGACTEEPDSVFSVLHARAVLD